MDLLLWFADELGFLSINENLQAAGGPPNIFAVGDVATSMVYPRPKAGVFAVRQGPPLTDNIRRSVFQITRVMLLPSVNNQKNSDKNQKTGFAAETMCFTNPCTA